MTTPRRILPGASYVVARRCTDRRFYFTPTPALVSDFKYVLACAADTFDIGKGVTEHLVARGVGWGRPWGWASEASGGGIGPRGNGLR